jgi:hypothetical protein
MQSQGHEEKERPILVSWGGAISTSSRTSIISRYSILKSNNHVKRVKVCKSLVVWLLIRRKRVCDPFKGKPICQWSRCQALVPMTSLMKAMD